MKTAILTLRIFLGLMGGVLVLQGTMWAFAPASNLEMNQIVTETALGMNMIKSDIGGPLMVAGIFLLLFAIKGREWYVPSIMIAGGYLLVRSVSFIVDGYHPTIVVGVVLESVVVVAAYFLNRLLVRAGG